jgi:hypothetical protein
MNFTDAPYLDLSDLPSLDDTAWSALYAEAQRRVTLSPRNREARFDLNVVKADGRRRGLLG